MRLPVRSLGLLGAALLPFAMLGLFLSGSVRDPSWADPIFHFYVVSLTSLVAVALALLILVVARQLRDTRIFFLGLAFVGIAGIFFVHAITTPGALVPNDNPWIGFSARLSLFTGAVFMTLSSIRWRPATQLRLARRQGLIMTIVLISILAFGVVAVRSSIADRPEALGEYAATGYDAPSMAAQPSAAVSADSDDLDSHLSQILDDPLLSVVGTIFTLALLARVCVSQLRLYRLSPTPTLTGFLISGIFLFQAQLSMSLAPAWHASWWEYHGLMLAALGAAVLGLILEYSHGGSLAGVVEGLLVRDTISQLQRGYTEVIVALVEAIEAKDPYTRGHTLRVSELAVHLGEELQLSPERLRVLHRSAMLHDIGKIAVPDTILNKPGRLTSEEFAIIQEHPVRGQQIVNQVRSLQREIGGIRSHHERLDGTGYPDGLRGEEIPMEARIIAVADVFDALTSSRAYRSSWTTDRAVEQIDRESGSKLDPQVVAALHRVLHRMSPAPSVRDEAPLVT